MLMSLPKVDDVCAEKQVKYKFQANHQKQINETLSLIINVNITNLY